MFSGEEFPGILLRNPNWVGTAIPREPRSPVDGVGVTDGVSVMDGVTEQVAVAVGDTVGIAVGVGVVVALLVGDGEICADGKLDGVDVGVAEDLMALHGDGVGVSVSVIEFVSTE